MKAEEPPQDLSTFIAQDIAHHSHEIVVTKKQLQDALNGIMCDGLRPVAISVGCLYAVFAFLGLGSQQE